MATVQELMRVARSRHRETSSKSEGKRFREILGIVRKYDLGKGITPESTVGLLQDLGPTFVKLGQIASTHPDVLPIDYCEALGALRTKVVPVDFDTVRAQVEQQLGQPIEQVFSMFSEVAVGSASIAQVHEARLADGTHVAVKVQRPGIVETVTDDLAIMERLVDLLEFVPGTEKFSFKDLVDEMVRTSTEELDFLNEARHLETFAKNNQGRDGVFCPKCYHDLCTPALLVEDFEESPCIEKIDELAFGESEREKIAYRIANNYMQQVMEDGFYHADPHAGNLLVAPDGSIGWIDFGIVGSMTSSQRSTLKTAVSALARGDAYALKSASQRMATPTRPLVQSDLLVKCEDLTARFVNVDLAEFDTAELVQAVMDLMKECGLKIEPFLAILLRGLVTLEGTIRLISPKLNIMKVLTEYMSTSLDADEIIARTRHFAARSLDSVRAMSELPVKAVDTLDMAQKGQIKLHFEMGTDHELATEIRGLGAIIVISAILAALILGACILGASGHGIMIGGVSLIGVLGLVLGVVMLIYVGIRTWKYLK